MRDDLLIEIQTRNFTAIRQKLEKLLISRRVRLVYPIADEKWISRIEDSDKIISRRKSPKRGVFEHAFAELVRLPKLLTNPNFSIELLLIQEEEVRRYDATRGWRRRGWITYERKLLKVVERRTLQMPEGIGTFIPAALAEPFSTSDLAVGISQPLWLAQKMVYCLRVMGYIKSVGKRGNSILYRKLRARTT